jgi:hypothetical protein
MAEDAITHRRVSHSTVESKWLDSLDLVQIHAAASHHSIKNFRVGSNDPCAEWPVFNNGGWPIESRDRSAATSTKAAAIYLIWHILVL